MLTFFVVILVIDMIINNYLCDNKHNRLNEVFTRLRLVEKKANGIDCDLYELYKHTQEISNRVWALEKQQQEPVNKPDSNPTPESKPETESISPCKNFKGEECGYAQPLQCAICKIFPDRPGFKVKKHEQPKPEPIGKDRNGTDIYIGDRMITNEYGFYFTVRENTKTKYISQSVLWKRGDTVGL